MEHVTIGVVIDLGLPSGTKWASCNVGATKPEELGGYYAWGEIEEQEMKWYHWSSYFADMLAYPEDPKDVGMEISGTGYDVAHMKWGGDWRMPTRAQCQELIDNCTTEQTTLNGVNGVRFTSNINGNSIFLPAAGCFHHRWQARRSSICYWASTRFSAGDEWRFAFCMNNSPFLKKTNEVRMTRRFYRYRGMSVRPVTK